MASARVFQVALVDRVYPAPDYFTPHVKNVITFIPGPGWSYKPAHVQSHDVVLYFVFDQGSSLARKKRLSARLFRAVPQYTKGMID